MTRLWTVVSQVSPSLRKIEWITFSTDRSVRNERLGDRRVVLPLGHLAQHVALARRQLVERRLLAPRVLRHQRLDDLRVDHRPAVCDGADRGDELVEILHALLQEVGATLAATLEEREHVARDRVLAEHDDADLGIGLAQPSRGLDAFVGAARRHADVRDDDVRPLCFDRREQRVEVAARRRDLEVGPRLEQAPDAFADEVVVLREHEPDRHGERIRR